jgi:YD repeat-containing protein
MLCAERVRQYIPSPSLTPQSASRTVFPRLIKPPTESHWRDFAMTVPAILRATPPRPLTPWSTIPRIIRPVTRNRAGRRLYSYDGDGRRVKNTDSTGSTLFVYNTGGQLIAEYTTGTPSGGGTSYLTTDHLGSTRVVTNSSGDVVSRHDYLPFGEEIVTPNIGGRTPGIGYRRSG